MGAMFDPSEKHVNQCHVWSACRLAVFLVCLLDFSSFSVINEHDLFQVLSQGFAVDKQDLFQVLSLGLTILCLKVRKSDFRCQTAAAYMCNSSIVHNCVCVPLSDIRFPAVYLYSSLIFVPFQIPLPGCF